MSALKFIMSEPVVLGSVVLLLLAFNPGLDADVLVVDLPGIAVTLLILLPASEVTADTDVGEGVGFDAGDVFSFLNVGIPSSTSDTDDNSLFVLTLLLLW